MKGVAILGSTGSIGRQALEVIHGQPEHFFVAGLAAGRNINLLREQVYKYKPRVVSVASRQDALMLSEEFGSGTTVCWGDHGLNAVAACNDAQTVLTSVTGTAGLVPTVAAIKAGKNIALANKETLVAAGALITSLAEENGVNIFPVDSEHSAIWQCLQSSQGGDVSSIILTASGGPFRKEPRDLSRVTVQMALAHPNWNMGKKITIDSSTLMNKGLEVIEARWLFGLDYNNIKVVVHPQSIIHSMVEFVDGSVLGQLGLPDMRLPIQYALTYPRRIPGSLPGLDWTRLHELTFEPPDYQRFPMLEMAYRAGRQGGAAPAVMNAANEVAVESFLEERITYPAIHHIVEEVLNSSRIDQCTDLERILEADRLARESALRLVRKWGA